MHCPCPGCDRIGICTQKFLSAKELAFASMCPGEARGTTMLDLKAIFSPDETVLACLNSVQEISPGITPADLPPDWHLLWDERAAIMEYDGGLPRERAEALVPDQATFCSIGSSNSHW